MKRLLVCALLISPVAMTTGCGEAASDKQPTMSGTPDPRIQGPAPVGGQGGEKKGGDAKPGSAVQ